MCFAICDHGCFRLDDEEFQFPFRRDVLCNIMTPWSGYRHHLEFQFPFRRDVLCNQSSWRGGLPLKEFQFTFRRDVLCNISRLRLS